MTAKIVDISGDEILDSRGHPTLRVHVHLEGGQSVSASVPAGASTGEGEAHELRDGDIRRYGGRGVQKALANLYELKSLLKGKDPALQAEIDQLLIECDGTESKARLGANTILGVSMAVARAGAAETGQHLYSYLNKASTYKMPVPMMFLGYKAGIPQPRFAFGSATARAASQSPRAALRPRLPCRPS
jgi:enolase